MNQDDKLQKYVCTFCYTKLNKLSKIEYDIQHRVEVLKQERLSLIKFLRDRYVKHPSYGIKSTPDVVVGTSYTSPKQPAGKHTITHSPTPRKVKKTLLFTPPKIRPKTTNSVDKEFYRIAFGYEYVTIVALTFWIL